MPASEAATTPTQELARPQVDPRMRERWIEARREEGRRRLRTLIAVVAALVVALGAFGVTRSPVMAVQQVEVAGGVHTTRQAVLDATGLGRGPQMLDLDLGNLRRRLTALPCVASASVRRHWPATVVVRLAEREPLAVVLDGRGQPMLVDGSGRVLDAAPSDTPGPSDTARLSDTAGSLPVIQGVPPAGGPGTSLGQAGRDALVVARALPLALAPGGPEKLKAVVIAADGTLEATLTPGITVVFGPIGVGHESDGAVNGLNAKLLAVRTLLERVDPASIATMDVRVPDSPILTHAGEGTTFSTTPRG